MAAPTLGSYYSLFWKKFWPGWSWGRDRLIPVVGGAIVIFLQARNGLAKPQNQWSAVGIVTEAYFGIIGVWLLTRAILAPWRVHCEQVAAAATATGQITQACEAELGAVRVDLTQLKRQLEAPKLRPEIPEHRIHEVPHPGEGLAQIGVRRMVGLADSDLYIWIRVRIQNDHRVPTTAGCRLDVVLRNGETHRADWEPNPEVRRFPPLDLRVPIEYGAPRGGWMYWRLRDKREADVLGGRLVLTVTDGIDAASTAEAAIQ
jgi:hypothetical protein